MAKLKGLFNYTGTFSGVTVVDSDTYGTHIRAVRGTHKPARLNDGMKRSGQMTIVANSFAKVIKDPFEPFRQGFKDGTMWYRLVSFVKLQLRDNGFVDFRGLEKFDFHKRFKLSYLFYTELEASISIGPERTLNVIARSRCTLKLNRDKADSYQQTLIVLFLEADFTPVVISESVILPLQPVQDREQCTSWAIPNFAKTAIVALKCDFFVQGASVNRESRKGMQIMKVMDVGSA